MSERPAAVGIHVSDAVDLRPCLEAVARHSPPGTDVLVVDERGDADAAPIDAASTGAVVRITVVGNPTPAGFAAAVNRASAAAGRRDLAIVAPGVVVGPDWLTRLRDAADSDSRIATATPLGDAGPYAPRPLPPDLTLDAAARALATGAERLRPPIPACDPHCTYVRRAAFDLIGRFDEALRAAADACADWSRRCVAAGFIHVCADDVLVHVPADVSTERHAPDATPMLEHALGRARQLLAGTTVVVDARCLEPRLMGTQRVTLETIRALTHHPRIAKVIAVVEDDAGREHLATASAGRPTLTIVSVAQAAAGLDADIVYRPYQIHSLVELAQLRTWGRRLVVAHLDLIAFHNPDYARDRRAWEHHRDVTRLALALADGVAFLSAHAERDCRTAGLLAPGQRTAVVSCGTDHLVPTASPSPPPALAADVAQAGFVLCFGTDYRHKNRVFALRVFRRMVAHGYPGGLVLAGPAMEAGSSRAAEAEYLRRHTALADRVAVLGSVSEAERTWLYGHAALVLHPTLYEGFGLVPFEAALAGAACLTSTQTALAEVVPADAETIASWDPDAVAQHAIALLGDEARRARLVGSIAARAAELTWSRTADNLVEFFDVVGRALPGPRIAAVEGDDGIIWARPLDPTSVELGLAEMLDTAYPPEFREALRAIAEREHLKRPFAGILVSLHRLMSALGRGRRPPTPS